MIRQATYADLHPAATLLAAAFHDEELFGTLIHPYREAYPEDFILFFERDLRVQYFDPSYVILVAVDEESGRVVGLGKWERQGEGAKLRAYPPMDPRMLIRRRS